MLCNCCGLDTCSPKVVVSRGNPRARLMVIGEAPGANEDVIGEPFVGRSGRALDTLIESVGLSVKEDVFICNAVKCRPPNNRRPSKSELHACSPWLDQQIELVDPWILVLAGSTAVEAILGIKGGISGLRGHWDKWRGRWVMPMFHPSYLLRNPSRDEGGPFALTRGDFLEVRNRLKESLQSSSMKSNNLNKFPLHD